MNIYFSNSHDAKMLFFRYSLKKTESNIIEALEARPGYVLKDTEVMDTASMSLDTCDRTVGVHISNMNKLAIHELGYHAISCRYGLGYMAMTLTIPRPSQKEIIPLLEKSYIDLRNFSLVNNHRRVPLTPREFQLAEKIFRNPHIPIEHQDIRNLFNENGERKITGGHLGPYIHALRKKLKTADITKNVIRKIHGSGYRASDEVICERLKPKRQII